MSWKEKMGPASFRGVQFHVSMAELGGGRRGPVHEYPLRDEPYREDIGRKIREFSVEGYVIGKEYMTARDALLSALEKSGPGELVHPYHGTRRVAVLTFRVRESPEDGGVARFSIDFVETPAAPAQPTAVPDAAGKLRTSASAAKAATQNEFLARYSPGTLLEGLSEALRSAAIKVDTITEGLPLGVQELATMKTRVARLQSSVTSLVSAPTALFSELSGLVDLFGAGGEAALVSVYDFDPGVRPPATTSNREREQRNFDALQRLVQRLVIVRACELAIDQTFDSYDRAVAQRTVLTDLLDEQAELAADDTYPALFQLRADLTKAVPGAESDLPRLVRHTPLANVPSLVLAHRLYGDLTLEADLVSRNGIRHPGFIRGGEELEVLSRG